MKSFVILMSLLILAKPVIPVVDYIMNYEYISKVLCVNKAKPVMHCNGKCHLMKELAKASENEKPVSDKKAAAHESEVLFFQEIYSFAIVCQPTSNESAVNKLYNNRYTYLSGNSAFHPPTFIS